MSRTPERGTGREAMDIALGFRFQTNPWRHSGRPQGDPESIGGLGTLRWIPDLRCAASGMTMRFRRTWSKGSRTGGFDGEAGGVAANLGEVAETGRRQRIADHGLVDL